MNKTVSILVAFILIFGVGLILINRSSNSKDTNSDQLVENVQIKDGVQYVTINAKNGYSPKLSNAKAGIPTKLIIKTKGTFDCSASLVIKSIGYQNILPKTGEEVIDIGTPKIQSSLQGLCSMGMYNFLINFN